MPTRSRRRRGWTLVKRWLCFLAPFWVKLGDAHYRDFPGRPGTLASHAASSPGKKVPMLGMGQNQAPLCLLFAFLCDDVVILSRRIVLVEIPILGKMDPKSKPGVSRQAGRAAHRAAVAQPDRVLRGGRQEVKKSPRCGQHEKFHTVCLKACQKYFSQRWKPPYDISRAKPIFHLLRRTASRLWRRCAGQTSLASTSARPQRTTTSVWKGRPKDQKFGSK